MIRHPPDAGLADTENCNSPSKAPLAEDCCSGHSCRFMRQHLDFIRVFPAFLQDRREGLTATVTSSSPNAPERRSESRSPLYQCDTHDRRGGDQDIRGSIRSAAFSHKPKSRGTNYFKGLAASGLRDQENLILGQRFASRLRHPRTFEHDRFKLNRSCSFFLSARPPAQGRDRA
jgi:hypothetical protein